jgi:hypothetical protein
VLRPALLEQRPLGAIVIHRRDAKVDRRFVSQDTEPQIELSRRGHRDPILDGTGGANVHRRALWIADVAHAGGRLRVRQLLRDRADRQHFDRCGVRGADPQPHLLPGRIARVVPPDGTIGVQQVDVRLAVRRHRRARSAVSERIGPGIVRSLFRKEIERGVDDHIRVGRARPDLQEAPVAGGPVRHVGINPGPDGAPARPRPLTERDSKAPIHVFHTRGGDRGIPGKSRSPDLFLRDKAPLHRVGNACGKWCAVARDRLELVNADELLRIARGGDAAGEKQNGGDAACHGDLVERASSYVIGGQVERTDDYNPDESAGSARPVTRHRPSATPLHEAQGVVLCRWVARAEYWTATMSPIWFTVPA